MEKKGINYLNCNRYKAPAPYGAYDFKASTRRYSAGAHTAHYNKPVITARRKLIKKRIPVTYQRIIDRSLKIGIAVYVYGLVVFAGLMLLVTLNASCEEKKNSVETLKSEINALRETNADKRTEITAGYDENEIAAKAQAMGMRKPKAYQIEYINVPKESYAKGGGAVEAATKDDETLFDWLLKLVNADS